MPRNKISRIEHGDFSRVAVEEIEACFSAMGARLEYRAVRRGADLDRLLDEVHARLAGEVAGALRRLGWLLEAEVTFSELGGRGSIDLLAWHSQTRTLLVVEIKSELGSVEGLLRPLDVKVRLAGKVARGRFGWQPATLARLVVLPDHRTARRQVERHSELLQAAFPVRSVGVRRWLASPAGPLSGLWFLPDALRRGVTRNPSSIRRVRKRRARPR